MSIAGLVHEARINGEKIKRHFAAHEATCKVEAGVSESDGSLASAIGDARKRAQAAINKAESGGGGKGKSGGGPDLTPRVASLEAENASMKAELKALKAVVDSLAAKLGAGLTLTPAAAPAPAPAPAKDEEEEDDDDLFGSDSDEDDEEKERIKAERLAAYAAKKQKKPGPIAKSSVILDVKPWEAETDMAQMEKDIRGIAMEGLVWGAGKLVPVAYGVKKLQIMCVVEDEKVSIDELTSKIEEFEDFVQSVDIAAFNKI